MRCRPGPIEMAAADRPVFQTTQDLKNDQEFQDPPSTESGWRSPPRAILLHPSRRRYTSRTCLSVAYCMEYQEWSMQVLPWNNPGRSLWNPAVTIPPSLRIRRRTFVSRGARRAGLPCTSTSTCQDYCLTAKIEAPLTNGHLL